VTSMLLDLLEESWSADEARCEFSHNNSVCTVQAAAKSVRTCTGDSRLSCRTIVAIHRGEMASMAARCGECRRRCAECWELHLI
jgi:hypothetical protein